MQEDKEERLRRLELSFAKTEMQIKYLADSMATMANDVGEAMRVVRSSQGITRIMNFITPLLLMIVMSIGGYVVTQYDKTNNKMWTQIDLNVKNIGELENRIIKIEMKVKP
jgi:uncharacterized coiled-coil protein SlyX